MQSHSGMLNGGHYISYASNPNKTWYCYNDSSCREIPVQQPHIDPGSAYLLFYERKGLNYPPYLPKVDDRPLPNGMAAGSSGGGGLNGMSNGGVGNGNGGIGGNGGGGMGGNVPHVLGGLGPADLDDVDPELRKTCTIS